MDIEGRLIDVVVGIFDVPATKPPAPGAPDPGRPPGPGVRAGDPAVSQ